MQFTDKYILNLKPKEKKYLKREARGFAIQVLPSGTKTFLYIFTWEGKRKNLNLGNYPYVKLSTARTKYNNAYEKLKNDIYPGKVKEVISDTPTTFGDFAKLYLAWSEEHHSSRYYDLNYLALNKYVLPAWEKKDIVEIKRRDAIGLFESIAARGMASASHRAACGVFNYAMDREYAESNPLLRLTAPVPSLKKVSRIRVLSEEEIKTLWSIIPDYLKLILVTAQRPGEVAGINAKEVTDEWWLIPAERTKTSKDQLVYLTETAKSFIACDGYSFRGDGTNKHINRDSMACYVSRNKYFGLPRWTPHDLRRTARTHMARIGIIDEHAEAVLGHAKQGIRGVYNKYEYQEEKKQAMLKWEQELLRIIKEKS